MTVHVLGIAPAVAVVPKVDIGRSAGLAP